MENLGIADYNLPSTELERLFEHPPEVEGPRSRVDKNYLSGGVDLGDIHTPFPDLK